jgi:hypothetical protein
VRHEVERLFGSPVVRAARVWGGYSPTPTFRLTLSDGQRAFFKGCTEAANPFAYAALWREERVYRELGGVIAPWAPAFYGALHVGEWRVLLLEDVGPKTAPPWTPWRARQVAEGLAVFHQAGLRHTYPDWVPRPAKWAAAGNWRTIAAEADGLRTIAALAGERQKEALAWLEQAQPRLDAAAHVIVDTPAPLTLLHNDTRSDNLRLREGRLVLFDWPWAQLGAPETEITVFAQSVAVEQGPDPEQVVEWYARRAPLRDELVTAAVAWWAAFFADVAWRPALPELPRLRPFQRRQCALTLRWAAKRLQLPDPAWTVALEDPNSRGV